MVLGADLGKETPAGLAQEIDEAHFGGGQGLAEGLGAPMLLEFNEEEIVAQLGLGEGVRIAMAMLVNEPDLAIVGVPGAIGVVMQSQELGEPGHGGIGMWVIDGIGVVPGRGPNARRQCGLRSGLAQCRGGGKLRAAVRLRVAIAGE